MYKKIIITGLTLIPLIISAACVSNVQNNDTKQQNYQEFDSLMQLWGLNIHAKDVQKYWGDNELLTNIIKLSKSSPTREHDSLIMSMLAYIFVNNNLSTKHFANSYLKYIEYFVPNYIFNASTTKESNAFFNFNSIELEAKNFIINEAFEILGTPIDNSAEFNKKLNVIAFVNAFENTIGTNVFNQKYTGSPLNNIEKNDWKNKLDIKYRTNDWLYNHSNEVRVKNVKLIQNRDKFFVTFNINNAANKRIDINTEVININGKKIINIQVEEVPKNAMYFDEFISYYSGRKNEPDNSLESYDISEIVQKDGLENIFAVYVNSTDAYNRHVNGYLNNLILKSPDLWTYYKQQTNTLDIPLIITRDALDFKYQNDAEFESIIDKISK
ncbi:hypothetical protein [Mycoplasma simbae]|uniref:hypothetical protein n=1 Tax=Mycoplasma simbae TaxID=36744 RepID=UPI0004979F62|nr:hypothetical protein [Mycoplasma simbae]